MKQWLRGRLIASAMAIGFSFFWAPTPASAQSTCAAFGTVNIDSKQPVEYVYQQNEWNSNQLQCATVSGVGFTLTTANFSLPTNGAPATYPSIFKGCHWGRCTGSNPFPIKDSSIASLTTSVAITQPAGYNNNAAYDIWFNKTSSTSGQPDGAEIMIWVNHQGTPQPFGSKVATSIIGGVMYDVWTGAQSGWNIISYVAQTPVTSARLNLVPFLGDAVARGSLNSSWWLIDVEFGFEVWSGGAGLAVSDFSVSLTPFPPGDVDGDGKTDRTVFRPGTGVWYTASSGGGARATPWGLSSDVDVSADYDGDGKTDLAVWRPSSGQWFIIRSGANTVQVLTWGASGDIPLAGDVDGDGKSDLVVFRPSNGIWYIAKSIGV